jgi:hypothetical protein
MNLLNLLMMLFVFSSDGITEPVYPPMSISGGTVIAELRSVSGGATEVRVLSGEEPFVSSSKAALQNWSLNSEKEGVDLVVVYFRQPTLYIVGNNSEEMTCTGADRSVPCPKHIVGPAYPALSVEKGSVVLRVEVGADGRISEIRTLKGMGVYTDVSTQAVREWTFAPAEDAEGVKKASHIYAVFVYLIPTNTNTRRK